MLYNDAEKLLVSGGALCIARLSRSPVNGTVLTKRESGVLIRIQVDTGNVMSDEASPVELRANDWALYEMLQPASAHNGPMKLKLRAADAPLSETIDEAIPDNSKEQEIKNRIAECLTILSQLRHDATSGEKKRLISIAMTELEGAELWVTKALNVD